MIREIKTILHYQLKKMQDFNSQNTHENLNKNTKFAKELNHKINTSHDRISKLRESIQNTKL